MEIDKILEQMEQFNEQNDWYSLLEMQLDEMTIDQGRMLPKRKTPLDCIQAILQENKDRVAFLTQNGRPDRQIPAYDMDKQKHQVYCTSTKKIFTYQGKDYYFGMVWGDEDTLSKSGKTLVGNGLAHILVNHGSQLNDILKYVTAAVATLNPKFIKQDRWGNLEIVNTVSGYRYVFKNYKELNDNVFYLHTAYKR